MLVFILPCCLPYHHDLESMSIYGDATSMQKLWMVNICLKDREPRKSLGPKANFIWVRNKLILPRDFSIVDYTTWSRFSCRNVALKISYKMIMYSLTFLNQNTALLIHTYRNWEMNFWIFLFVANTLYISMMPHYFFC